MSYQYDPENGAKELNLKSDTVRVCWEHMSPIDPKINRSLLFYPRSVYDRLNTFWGAPKLQQIVDRPIDNVITLGYHIFEGGALTIISL